MKLVERYALETGLKIGSQWLKEDFFPLPFTKYITLHASSGMQGKNYQYYPEVLTMLKPFLDREGISVVQFGGKDDGPLPGCFHIMGKYSIAQGSFLLRSSLLHIGNDSIWGHRAGHIGIPLVQPFGPTDFRNHSCYDSDPSKTIFIESHRWGRKPTFASQENPSTIALIPPEDLANAVLKLLGLNNRISEKTVLIGNLYNMAMIEWIPNCSLDPTFNAYIPMTARMDKHFDENALANMLNGRKINIITNKVINPNLLANFKSNIITYNHELVDDCLPSYISIVKSIVPRSVFFTRSRDSEAVSKLRFKYFDYCTIEQALDKTRDDFLNDVKSYLNYPIQKVLSSDNLEQLDKLVNLDRLVFKTNKPVISKGKIYPSHAHEAADLPITPNGVCQVIDNEVYIHETINHRIFLP